MSMGFENGLHSLPSTPRGDVQERFSSSPQVSSLSRNTDETITSVNRARNEALAKIPRTSSSSSIRFNFSEAQRLTQTRLIAARSTTARYDANLVKRLERRVENLQFLQDTLSKPGFTLTGIWGWGDGCTIKARANAGISQYDTFFLRMHSGQTLALQLDSSFQSQLEGVEPNLFDTPHPSDISSHGRVYEPTQRGSRKLSDQFTYCGNRFDNTETFNHCLRTAKVQTTRLTQEHVKRRPEPSLVRRDSVSSLCSDLDEESPHLESKRSPQMEEKSVASIVQKTDQLLRSPKPSSIKRELETLKGEFLSPQASYVARHADLTLPHNPTLTESTKKQYTSEKRSEIHRAVQEDLQHHKIDNAFRYGIGHCEYLTEFPSKISEKIVRALVNASVGSPIQPLYASQNLGIPEALAERVLQKLSTLEFDGDVLTQIRQLSFQRYKEKNRDGRWNDDALFNQQDRLFQDLIEKWKTGTSQKPQTVSFESLVANGMLDVENVNIARDLSSVRFTKDGEEKTSDFPVFFDTWHTSRFLFELVRSAAVEIYGEGSDATQATWQTWEAILYESKETKALLDAYEICCPECSKFELNGMVKFGLTKCYPETMARICKVIGIDSQPVLEQIEEYIKDLNRETNPKQALMLANQLKTVYDELYRRYHGTSTYGSLQPELEELQWVSLHLLDRVYQWEVDILSSGEVDIESNKAVVGLTKNELLAANSMVDKLLSAWLLNLSEVPEYDRLRSNLRQIKSHPKLRTEVTQGLRGDGKTSAISGKRGHREEDHRDVSKPRDVNFASKTPEVAIMELVSPKKSVIFQGMLGSGKTTLLRRLEKEGGLQFFQVQNDGAGGFDAASFGGATPTPGKVTLFHHYREEKAKDEEYQSFKQDVLDHLLPITAEEEKSVVTTPANPDVYPISGGCVCCGQDEVKELKTVFDRVQVGYQGFGRHHFVTEITGVGLGQEVLHEQSADPLGRMMYTHLITVINPDDANWDAIPSQIFQSRQDRQRFFDQNPDLEVYFDQLVASRWIINTRHGSENRVQRIQHIQKLIRAANPGLDDRNIQIVDVKKGNIQDLQHLFEGATLNPQTFDDLPDEEDVSESLKLRLTSHSLNVGVLTETQFQQLIEYLDQDRQRDRSEKTIPRFKGVVRVGGSTQKIFKVESNGSSAVVVEEVK